MIHRPQQAAVASAEATAPASPSPATPPLAAPAVPVPDVRIPPQWQSPAAQDSRLPVPPLQDIHQPAPVGFWPPAPGWWLLAALIAAGAITLLRTLRRRRRGNAYRRAAQAELLAAWQAYQQAGDATAYLKQLNQILKRAALAAFPRQQVASLTGEAWLAFLDAGFSGAGGEQNRFRSEQGRLLLTAPYRPSHPAEDETRALHDMGLRWLRQHRRPGAARAARPATQAAGGPPARPPKQPSNKAREVDHAAP